MKMERIWVGGWLIWAAMVVVAELKGSSGCLEKERTGLMKLWEVVKPNDLATLTSDCCSWKGVDCSAATGRVESLMFVSIDRIPLGSPAYFLNASLLLPFEELLNLTLYGFGIINHEDLSKLPRLQELIIHSKNVRNTVSLQAFAHIKNLKYLDLRENYINISNLEGICDMKNLVELLLGGNKIRGHLPLCIGNLTRLQFLDLSNNQIGGSIPSTIGNLSRLSSLFLDGNYWSGVFSLHSLANNSKLNHLGLSSLHNDFQLETETQSWVPSFQLFSLDLSNCNLNKMSDSIVPTFLLHQFELMFVELSVNNLQDTFPSWLLQNNSNLQDLWMRNNFLTGNLILPNFIHDLTWLDISNNKMDGKLPDKLQVFLPKLQFLYIAKNRFEGDLPSWFGALEKLQYVDLSSNSFTGKLSKTLFGNNTDLNSIDFSNNLLHGEISLNLTALPSLNYLMLSDNKFNGSLEELSSRSLSSLLYIDVSNNLMSGILPNSIANFPFLRYLKVSNNSFEGGFPDKLCHISYLDISHNNFSGSIPSCLGTSSMVVLYMRNCGFSGVIPDGLSINSTLQALDLSYNDFSLSALPNWIYSQHELQILIMAGLQLEGEISTYLCGLENIKIMDLSHNNFNGSIPSCLFKKSFWVAEILDYGDEKRNDFGVEFTAKGILNRFQGSILNRMTGLDVSSNKLSGQIPPQIGDSEAIHALNLSNNRLWGSIPINISRLRAIESLDLSSNNLSGEIPSEIVSINFLSYFNVSNNNLSGPTPNGGQFSNFDEQNYGGNKFLCGPRLRRACTMSAPSTPPGEQDNDETPSDNDEERTSFWWSFGVSYVTVIISLFVLVGINTHFSRVWLRIVDIFCSKLFSVFAKMKFLLPKK